MEHTGICWGIDLFLNNKDRLVTIQAFGALLLKEEDLSIC